MNDQPPRLQEHNGDDHPSERRKSSEKTGASLPIELVRLQARINTDAPRTTGSRVFELLKLCGSSSQKAWAKTCQLVVWGADQITDRERRLILAKAEAQTQIIKAEAEADKTRAEAEKLRAEADVARAQGIALATETRAETSRRDQLLKQLKSRGFDWRGEFEEGVLQIVVTKKEEKPRKSGQKGKD